MRRLLVFLLLALAGFAWAANPGVIDDAHLFSPSTVRTANQHLSRIATNVHKNVMIVTVPSLNGDTLDGIKSRYTGEQPTALFILIDQADHKTYVNVGNHTQELFPPDRMTSLRQAFNNEFRQGNYDRGLQDGVTYIEQTFATAPRAGTSAAPVRPASGGGINWAGWILLAVVVFVVLSIFRGFANRGGGMAYSTGYGPRPYYGPGGGGGGFWSGLLGGIGGSFLGNALYDHFERRNDAGSFNQPPVEPSQPDWQQPDTSSTWDTGSSWDTSGGGGGSDWSGGGGGGDWS